MNFTLFFVVQVRKNFRMVRENGDSMFLVRRTQSVIRNYRPAVIKGVYVRHAKIYHRFDCKNHSRLYARICTAERTVRNARVFVNVKTYSVSAIVVYNAVTVPVCNFVHGICNIAYSVSYAADLYCCGNTFKCNLFKCPHLGL